MVERAATPLQAHMIQSAESYHQYLKDQNKGRIEYRVVSIQAFEEDTYKLKLDKKLGDTDSILFEIFAESFKQTQIQILEYDADNCFMVVRPNKQSEKCVGLMRKASSTDILLVSDLRFLVRRTKDWYEEYGQLLRFPTKAGSVHTPIGTVKGQRPSDDQVQAILAALSSPSCYIWGAPGTGKTQFVLGYCVTHYIHTKQRIAIFAPTNNSIDQVLRGVIKLLKPAGIDYEDKILRLGAPTKQFAEEYPEICEFQGIAKQIERYKQQVKTLKEALYYKTFPIRRGIIQNTYQMMLQMSEAVARRVSISRKIANAEKGIKLIEEALSSEQARREREEESARRIEISMQGALYRMYSALRSGDTGKAAQLASTRKEISIIINRIKTIEAKLTASRTEKAALERELSGSTDLFIPAILQMSKDIDSLYEITRKLNIANLENCIRDTKALLERGDSWYQSRVGRYAEYEHQTADEIQNQILEMNRKIEDLKKRTTAERSKHVCVIAGTLDAYISRISHENGKEVLDGEAELSFAHVFLDEAGYANLAKGSTLFACQCPITFLGDHFQLPPVCEMDFDDALDARYPNAWLWGETSLQVESLFTRPIDDLKKSFLEGRAPVFIKMPKCDLHKTYRFGPELSTLLNQHVYENCGFQSAPGVDSFRIEYINAPRRTAPEKKRENLDEAKAIQTYVRQHVNEDIAVLTPYRNQLHQLERLCPDLKRKDCILTVHGSQGREWDTVILSVCDTSDMYFTNTQNRSSKGKLLINTAVSRAKKRLILVCDYSYWTQKNGQMICALLKNARRVN